MREDDIAVVLQIRRARERTAERALLQAQQAQSDAAAQRGRIEETVNAFATQRGAQEAAVLRTLSAGPVSGQQMRMAAAQLAGIVADAEHLRQNVAEAALREAACAGITRDAQRAFATASRDSLGVSMLQRQVDAARRIAAAREVDNEMEEVAALCTASRSAGARS
jgi:Type III secretion protein YscO